MNKNFILIFFLIWTFAAGCPSGEKNLVGEPQPDVLLPKPEPEPTSETGPAQQEPEPTTGPNSTPEPDSKPTQEPPAPVAVSLVPEPDLLPRPEPAPEPVPCLPSGDYSNCPEVVSGHNNLCENRMNLVFVGVSYADMPAVISAVETAVDYDENNGGLLSVEPFKSNKNKFNFFYVNQVGAYDTSALGWGEWPTGVGRVIDDLGALCPVTTNKYVTGLINWSFSGSNPDGVSFADPSSGRDINTFIHEVGGHLLGNLNDEYLGGSGLGESNVPWGLVEQSFYSPHVVCVCNPVDNPTWPCRCVSTVESYADCLANSPWHDLIGSGCREDGVIDCFEIELDNPQCASLGYCRDRVIDLIGGGSYRNEVGCFMESGFVNYYRSVNGSFMFFQSPPFFFGASNERLICEKIREITGSVGGICDRLCLDRCPVGQSCIQGSCQPTDRPSPSPGCSPTRLKATLNSCTDMRIEWEPPLDPSCRAVNYRVERGSAVIGTVSAGNAMAFSDSSLSGSTTYTHTISSLDAGGVAIGDQQIVTITPACGCSLRGMLIVPNCDSIQLFWSLPRSGCPSIHQYRFARNDRLDSVTLDARRSSWLDIATHLEETPYSYTVTTLDSTGAVIATQEIGTTTPFCSGCSPSNLVSAPNSCSEIVFTWAPPADSRCEISRYQVRLHSGSGWSRGYILARDPLRIVYSDLLGSTEYRFEVYSENVGVLGNPAFLTSSTPACP